MNITERRLITVFKNFVERVFVPQFSKIDLSCLQEWNKFSSMISTQQINLTQLQQYVDTLPSMIPTLPSNYEQRNISSHASKTKKENINDQTGNMMNFNPNKTFGGPRSKALNFQLPSQVEQNEKKQISYTKEQQLITTQTLIPALERLYKNIVQNHQKLQNLPAFNDVKAYYT